MTGTALCTLLPRCDDCKRFNDQVAARTKNPALLLTDVRLHAYLSGRVRQDVWMKKAVTLGEETKQVRAMCYTLERFYAPLHALCSAGCDRPNWRSCMNMNLRSGCGIPLLRISPQDSVSMQGCVAEDVSREIKPDDVVHVSAGTGL